MTEKIGICLEGGGAAGCVQAGMLWAMHKWADEHNIAIHAIAGASVGSLNGALFLQNPTQLLDVWQHIKPSQVYNHWHSHWYSWYSNKPLLSLIRDNLDMKALRVSNTTLHIQTCERDTGQTTIVSQHIFNPDDFALWLLASASIPVVFPQTEIHGRWFVDGGVADNSPLWPLAKAQCSTILLLRCSPRKPAHTRQRPLRLIPMAIHTIRLLYWANQESDAQHLLDLNSMVESGKAKPDKRIIRLIQIRPTIDVGLMDFDADTAKKGIEDGYAAAETVLRLEFPRETARDAPESTNGGLAV